MKKLMKNLMIVGTLLALAGTAFAGTGTRFLENSEISEISENSEKSVPAETVPAESVPALSDFQKAIANSEFWVNGEKLKINAKFFIVLSSASWCGPCRSEMPKIAKIYREEIKQNPDVELVQISFDKNQKRAIWWAERDGMEFPITHRISGVPVIFGTSQPMPLGIPSVSFFKSSGEHIATGHPAAIFERWKEFCEQN